MYLKRFRSPDVRSALRAVREALGPEALVLSTHLVPARGWRGLMGHREVEVTAAAEREASAPRPEASVERHSPPEDPVSGVVAQLVAAGVDQVTAQNIADAIPASNRRAPSPVSLRRALAAQLSELAASEDAYARAEVFVGPPGAGKTTTIAKIAAQERARRGPRLGLIAADGFRVGAIEHLRTYADILDAPFGVARTISDLDRTLAAEHPTPVLVDTAGRSPADADTQALFGVIGAASGVRTHLVLPAGTSPAAARRIFDAYAEARPSRVVLTKLDEAESLSPLVPLLRERQLPVSFLGTGQRVPDDLNRATAQLLAASVLGESPLVQLS